MKKERKNVLSHLFNINKPCFNIHDPDQTGSVSWYSVLLMCNLSRMFRSNRRVLDRILDFANDSDASIDSNETLEIRYSA